MPITAALALLLALSAPSRAADAPLLEVQSRRVILPASFMPVTSAAITAPLSLVVEAGSAWDSPGVLERVLGKASAIFGRCGVALGEAEVITVRWTPEGLRRLNVTNPYAGPAQIAVMDDRSLPVRRPTGFLFGRSVPSTASAYNVSSVDALAAAHPAAAKLLNTFWITIDQEQRRPSDFAPTYSMAAHELAHLFGDLPHTPASPNLMTDADSAGAKSGDLLEKQCVEIRRLRGL